MHSFLLKIAAFLRRRYFLSCPAGVFNLCFALLVLAVYNQTFFTKIHELSGSSLFTFLTFVCFAALFNMAAALLFFKYSLKVLTILILCVNAAVYDFMTTYNIAVDKIMLLNVLETDAKEIADLVNWHSAGIFFCFGLLPSYLVYKIRVIYRPFVRELFVRALIVLLSAGIAGGLIFCDFKNVAQFARNNRDVKYYLLPVNYIGAVISAVKIKLRSNHPLVKIGEDARMHFHRQENGKKNLIVLVVGETARAANFSLNGYARDTNAPLQKYLSDLINYPHVSACGTSTAVSVPCMFSAGGRKTFDAGRASYTENVLDIMQRAGYKVWWRENNSGCKGVCSRVETEELCFGDGYCPDMNLRRGLVDKLAADFRDTVVVLHQQGSHGPAYYLRYSGESARYLPACETERFDKCRREEIVNAYDNTIYETSRFLAALMADLQRLGGKYNPILIYVSDHGESLGENGIYLHAAPYVIAPKEQVNVPFLFWLPDETAAALQIDRDCLQRHAGDVYSHDNLFHSLLGFGAVQTSLYQPELDIFAQCRKSE